MSGGADDGSGFSCARLITGRLRCWGYGRNGQLGYGNTSNIGDNETPGSVGPVNLGPGRTTAAVSAGAFHTCALLDDASVRCWGFGGDGRLGYGNMNNVGDDEAAGAAGPVSLNGPAVAISAGGGHTCAVLDDGSVRCWGFGGNGRLGYGSTRNIGDNETPVSVGPVNLGSGRTAKAISAGGGHTCAVLDDGSVRCWGFGLDGRLGYTNVHNDVGDTETPASTGPVDIGKDRSAQAITAGGDHTCALLDDGSVRCWGFGGNGRLGYGNTRTIGDDETPGSVGPVDLGRGRSAQAISAGDDHTCALLDDRSVRCWGFAGDGRLGYGNTDDIGDDETPGSVAAVDLGSGRSAVAISAGGRHTCALLDDDALRCWGAGAFGRLGYCNENDIGDDESPGSVGPLDVSGTSACPGALGSKPAGGSPAVARAPTATSGTLAEQARRKRAFQSCSKRVRRHAMRELRRLGRRTSRRRRVRAKRHIRRHASRGRSACRKRYGRTPGRVTRLTAHAVARDTLVLSFAAPGTDGSRPPAARVYIVKQSRRPIRGRRSFRRAQTLCGGGCRLEVPAVGAMIRLTVDDLRPGTTYYYSVAARDNVSGRPGPRSRTVETRTRR